MRCSRCSSARGSSVIIMKDSLLLANSSMTGARLRSTRHAAQPLDGALRGFGFAATQIAIGSYIQGSSSRTMLPNTSSVTGSSPPRRRGASYPRSSLDGTAGAGACCADPCPRGCHRAWQNAPLRRARWLRAPPGSRAEAAHASLRAPQRRMAWSFISISEDHRLANSRRQRSSGSGDAADWLIECKISSKSPPYPASWPETAKAPR
jgi:hypothetical protein